MNFDTDGVTLEGSTLVNINDAYTTALAPSESGVSLMSHNPGHAICMVKRLKICTFLRGISFS